MRVVKSRRIPAKLKRRTGLRPNGCRKHCPARSASRGVSLTLRWPSLTLRWPSLALTKSINQGGGMLRIWGRSNSVNVQKALWFCEEMNLPYERVDAGGTFGVVNTQQYRHLNPNGLVPTIEEDGFVLWESNAIVRYLTAKHSLGKLWPEDLNIRAEADKWMDWQNTTFWPTFRPLFWNLVRTPPNQRDAGAMEESRLKTAEILGYLDAHLKNRAYIVGD